MTVPSFAENLHAYAEAKNRHDIEVALSFCTDDSVYETVSTGQRFVGKDGLREYYTALWQAIPDYTAHFEDVAYGNDSAVVWGRITGTLLGDQLGLPATGAALDFPIVFVCNFRDGLLARDRGFFDLDLVYRQAGVKAAPEEDAEREASDFVERFSRAHKERTGAALAALFHPDATIAYPTQADALDPHAVREFWDNGRLLLPDLDVRTVSWASRGADVFIEWEASATVAGEVVTWRGADRFTVRNGLAVSEGNYWDTRVLDALTAARP